MRTRNSNFPNNSPVTIPRRRNRRRAPNVVEPELRTIVEVAPMAERTMEELLRAPTEGYGEAIVIPEINADHFEIKTNLLQLVQASPFHGFERENPHTHINNFKRITSTLKFRDVPNDVIKLMMFPYLLEGAARVCKAWERFKEMLRACPRHRFTELTQIDTFYNGLNDNDQVSLNAAAGGNLLSKTTREALNIIENKSKVRYSRNKSNVSRMNMNSRESSSKTDERIDKLADQIWTLVEIVSKKVVTPATVKAVEESCVTCGGAHAYYNCPNTDSNQSSVCAATGTYNQVAPPNRVSNHMAPPGFSSVQNNGQNRYNQNQGQGNNFNRGNNFHGNQVQQGVPNEFSNYMKSNDQMMRNMQNQINSLKGEVKNEIQNTMKTQQAVLMNQQNVFQTNLQNMLSGFFQNQASTSGTLPSNTIPNPKGEMKAITTRSGVAYEGPSIPTNPSPKKVVERETEETTDKEQTNFQGSTAHIPPPVNPIPIPEPDVPKTLPKPNIPYPSRRNDQKFREKASYQKEKIFQMFQDLRFDISFADALFFMPRFAPTIRNLLMNKEKLLELAKIPLNENCSAMLLKKLPEKLGDPGKFLIPCNFPGMDVCHALADLGASINLMPLSIWKKLSLPELTPTRMTLELADRSITHPKGLTEDVYVKVGKFHFPTDFVVVDFEADPRVPLILGRSFLRTDRALIDVYGEEITLRVNNKAITFNLDQTTKFYSSYDDVLINRIDIIDEVCEEYAPELLGFSNKSLGGNPTPMFEPLTSEFILEEIEAYLKDDSISPEIDHADCNSEGDICLIEKLLNNDPFQLPLMDLKQGEIIKAKPSMEEPPELELKDLPSHLEYAYLEENDKLPVIIAKGLKDDEKDALLKEVLKLLDAGMIYPISDSPWVSPVHYVPKKGGITVVANEENELIRHGISQIRIISKDQEKTTFTCPYGTFAYRRMPFGLCNAPGTFQRCMMAIFHDMIEKTMEVFMDDFSVFRDSFDLFLSNFRKREGIVLGHKISKFGIVVDHAKVDVIAKLPHPTTVKGVRSFLGHAGLYLMLFRLLKKSLPIALILVCPIGILPFDIICDASDVAIGDGFRTTKIEALVASITMLSKDNDRAQIIHYHEKGRCLPLSFTITKIFPYGTIELSQPDGPNFKVNGHRVKHYFRGGTLPPKCKRSTKGSDIRNATLAIRVLIKYQSNGHKMDPMIGKDSRDEINSRGACKESLDHSSQAYK
ncbi:reverse transcriptase domain-containing protein [Tanacetum coccineum]